MFDSIKGFFNDESKGEMSETVAKLGMNILHFIKFLFLAYSGVHGVSAAIGYAGATEWQRAFQVAGIIINELVLAGIYLMAVNGRIQGAPQTLAAAGTYLVGFAFAAMGIVADSQLNAGMALSGFMVAYLHWGLPLSPAIAAVGAFAIDLTSPEKIRDRKRRAMERMAEDEAFRHDIAMRRAKNQEQSLQAGIQLAATQAMLTHMQEAYTGSEAQEAIKRTAVARLPQLLSGSGIVMPSATIIEQSPAPASPEPVNVPEPTSERPEVMATHVPVQAPEARPIRATSEEEPEVEIVLNEDNLYVAEIKPTRTPKDSMADFI